MLLVLLFIPISSSADASGFDVQKHYLDIAYSFNDEGYTFKAKTTTVDYTTGRMATKEEVIPELAEWTKPGHFYELRTDIEKKPGTYLMYGVLYERDKPDTERVLFSYQFQTHEFRVIKHLKSGEGTWLQPFISQGVYEIVHQDGSAAIYSLATGKYINKAVGTVSAYRGEFLYLPTVQYGDLLFYDNNQKSYIHLKSDGKLIKLERPSPTDENVQYSRKVGKSTYRRYKKGSEVRVELVAPSGKVTVLNTVNLNIRNSWQWTYEMFSPQGKYVTTYKILSKESSRLEVFDTDTGKKINSMVFQTRARFSDSYLYWRRTGSDHIVQSAMSADYYFNLKNGVYVRESNSGTSSNWTYSSFPDSLMVEEDPIAIKYKDQFVQYTGQGTFVSKNSQEYVPVRALMKTLSGTLTSKNGVTTLSFNQKKLALDKSKIITWDSQTYYPLRDITKAFGLQMKFRNSRANYVANGYPEIEIY
ncbi:copper amine oxidase N-terminal domain-containing protein [Paenibacillus profundus]|uniref:Copper amine oxidase N-terminal domain-containing protein n=1 Tax=Paenibacillus profundus TaxID=1173085 RepID=A0ABS8YRK6_9BACL|nr:copper amine oxidase N-terminal domain-containing protein [Paenibacillus profundus]MCE5172980.1 copper amine oxidase N-terminal domain-containing protein [Paenibacillus profundus]